MHTMERILAKIIKPIQDHAKNIVFVKSYIFELLFQSAAQFLMLVL